MLGCVVSLDMGRNEILPSSQNEVDPIRTGMLNDLKVRYRQVKVSLKLSSHLRAL